MSRRTRRRACQNDARRPRCSRQSTREQTMLTRRNVLQAAGTGALMAAAGWPSARAQQPALTLSPALPEGVRQAAALDALPGKKPLIKLAYRPPNYETPIEYLRD